MGKTRSVQRSGYRRRGREVSVCFWVRDWTVRIPLLPRVALGGPSVEQDPPASATSLKENNFPQTQVKT
jgi:hypothetical protein